ncbi:MAG: PfkB family carbohydrate kinase [Candidatus Sumerlaeaceae bacterium]
MSVLVVGSVALDNVRTPFGEVKEALGGSCAYAATSASYFADVAVVGVVGGDFPPEHFQLLQSRGIDTDGLEVDANGSTFRWRGYYEYDMNQAHTLETALNVFAKFQPKVPDSLRKHPYVMLGNIDPELQLEVLAQMEKPRLAMADTMNFWIEGKQETLLKVLKQCDVVLLNDAEARQLCDTANLQKAARQLMKMGIGRVIIKKGEHGCLMFSEKDYFVAPAFPLEKVKDPTGAGDTFAGGFIGYLAGARNLDETTFRQAVIVGTTMASFTVEEFSLARIGHLQHEEIVARCARLRTHTEFPPVSIDARLVV